MIFVISSITAMRGVHKKVVENSRLSPFSLSWCDSREFFCVLGVALSLVDMIGLSIESPGAIPALRKQEQIAGVIDFSQVTGCFCVVAVAVICCVLSSESALDTRQKRGECSWLRFHLHLLGRSWEFFAVVFRGDSPK